MDTLMKETREFSFLLFSFSFSFSFFFLYLPILNHFGTALDTSLFVCLVSAGSDDDDDDGAFTLPVLFGTVTPATAKTKSAKPLH